MPKVAAKNDKPSDSRFKLFLNRHCYLVDFFSASLLVCLCLIILVPRVHESFSHNDHNPGGGTASPNVIKPLSQPLGTSDDDNQHNQHNQHQHPNQHQHQHQGQHEGFPTGEFLICVGFFVFYSAGLGLGATPDTQQRTVMSTGSRRQSVCCSSTRCPSSQQAPQQPVRTPDESSSILPSEDGCVMLLNRHHQHHTHNSHHDHQHQPMATINQRTTYGSGARPARPVTIVVDEIRIVSEPTRQPSIKAQWPQSLKMLIFSVILAIFLIFFEMRVSGMLRAIKVFRACSTGALLYVAFFIMLPRDSASCRPCDEEEEEDK